MKSKLILASASPRRLDLLKRLGFTPDEVIPSDIDESVKKGEKPEAYVKRMAEEKAEKIKRTDAFVLGADTTVVCANRIIGKAENRDEAKKIMELLRGRKHKVLTAICVIAPNGEKRTKLVTTSVKFKNATDSEIEEYLDTNEWVGKAGAYGIQGDPGGFCISINGSFSSVVGLPMYETKNMLLGLGFKRS
jgi:septum formation protein